MLLLSRSVSNAHVVREVDQRASRDLLWLLLLVAALAGGLALYAWPHLAQRQTGMAMEQMYRERERLVEANRKLRLEKASLENLKRVEAIATRELGLQSPSPAQVIVVERGRSLPDAARVARSGAEPQPERRP
jgi:cell division protein FtsL